MVDSKKDFLIPAFCVFLFVVAAIFVLNIWISRQVDETPEPVSFSLPVSSARIFKPVGKPRVLEKPVPAVMSAGPEEPVLAPVPNGRLEDEEEEPVYEMPLDSDILVQ